MTKSGFWLNVVLGTLGIVALLTLAGVFGGIGLVFIVLTVTAIRKH